MGCQSQKGPQASSGQNFYCLDDNLLPRGGEGLSWAHKEVQQGRSHGWPFRSTTLYSDRYHALPGAPKCPGHRGPQVTLGRHTKTPVPPSPRGSFAGHHLPSWYFLGTFLGPAL